MVSHSGSRPSGGLMTYRDGSGNRSNPKPPHPGGTAWTSGSTPIGKALGLEVDKHITDDRATIKVRQSIWNGKVQFPKTPNAIRDIDLAPSLARMLRDFIGRGRTAGFLFQTKGGRSISPSDVLTCDPHPILEGMGREKYGFHAFRRFRTTWLRKNGVPEDLIRYWIGHADKSVTDGYSRVKEDVKFREKVCGEVRLGFQLTEIRADRPNLVPIVPKTLCGWS
jgi:Phage integrase family